jgi:hypothetical protein
MSDSTNSVERRRIEDWWGYPSYDDQDKRLPGETSLGKAVRLESRDYVQQGRAAGHKPSPAYGEPGFVMSEPARGNPTQKMGKQPLGD